jgi:hypothetical protein
MTCAYDATRPSWWWQWFLWQSTHPGGGLLGSNTTSPGFAAALCAVVVAAGFPRASVLGWASGASHPVASPIRRAAVATLWFLRIIAIIAGVTWAAQRAR